MASSAKPDAFTELDAATALLGIVMPSQPAPLRAQVATKGQPVAGAVQKVKIKRGPRGPYKPRKPKVLAPPPLRPPESPETTHKTPPDSPPLTDAGMPRPPLRHESSMPAMQRGPERSMSSGYVPQPPLPARAAYMQQPQQHVHQQLPIHPHAPVPYHMPGAELHHNWGAAPMQSPRHALPAQPVVPSYASLKAGLTASFLPPML